MSQVCYLDTDRYLCIVGDSKQTRLLILKEASKLFNVQGYAATSLSDITTATGLTKGAIYRHFGSKTGLEKEALTYMCSAMMDQVASLIKAEKTAPDKLMVILDFYGGYAVNPPFHGGCPLTNASIEMDDSDSGLRDVVNEVTKKLHASVKHIIEKGIEHGQLNEQMDSSSFASLLVASVEGAISMMKVTGVKKHLRDVVGILKLQVQSMTIK